MQEKIVLVGETFSRNSIGEEIPSPVFKEAWADIQSPAGKAWSEAGLLGIEPTFVAKMPVINYRGQKILQRRKVNFSIYRTYLDEQTDEIWLYCQTAVGITHTFDIYSRYLAYYINDPEYGSGYLYTSEGQLYMVKRNDSSGGV